MFTTPGNPKLGATYFHNFNSIIADTGTTAATFSPASLGVTFTNLPSTASSALFESSNGTFYEVIWNNVVNGNIGNSTPVTVSPTTVTVAFDKGGAIKTFDPTLGTAVQSSATGSSISIPLTDHPMVVALAPLATATPIPATWRHVLSQL
jgi:hypothetical protein